MQFLQHRSLNRRDEGVAKGVWPDWLVDPGSTGDAPYDPAGGMPVKAPSIGADEDGSRQALADGEVDSPGCAWRQRHRHNLASFAHHRQRPVAALEPEGLDVGANGFRYTEAVQGEERDEGVLGRCAEARSHQERADLVTVEGDGVGFVVEPRPADMDCRRRRHRPSSSA